MALESSAAQQHAAALTLQRKAAQAAKRLDAQEKELSAREQAMAHRARDAPRPFRSPNPGTRKAKRRDWYVENAKNKSSSSGGKPGGGGGSWKRKW